MPSEKRPQCPGQPQGQPEHPPALGRDLILFLCWILLLGSLLMRSPRQQDVPYSEFIHQVESGEVATATVSPERIRYTLRADVANAQAEGEQAVQPLWQTQPVASDMALTQLLRANDVEFSGAPSRNSGGFWNWFWIVLIISMGWSFFSNRGKGLGSAMLPMGKSNARIYAEGSTGVTFDDVAGVDEAKTELLEIVDFLQHTDKYTRLGAKIPTGVLLVGPPGTGKTLLARAIAGEAKVPFFSISASEFIEMFVGVGASRVRSLFEQAKGKAPCIVFIDELDALGKSRSAGPMSGGHDEREQTLNQLLSEMDGFDPNTGVILLAATNRPEVLDPALLRPGRFDRRILVDRPDRMGRRAILDVHSIRVILAEDVDLDKLAARTPGFAGADLANLINEAALLAARRNANAVAMEDFNEALERVLTGIEKKSRVLNDLERQTVAYHEVGHAIIGQLMPGAGKIEKISIVPRGIGALGYTLQMPEEDRFLMMEDEIRGRLATLLGGRAAEEFIFGKVSTGASDDIQKATDLAERFVTVYGMSKDLGPIAFEKTQQQFLEGYGNPRRTVSPKVEEAIDQAVKQLIDSAHAIALKVISHNRLLLETTAQSLLEHETLEGPKLRAELNKVQRPNQLQPWLDSGQLLNPASDSMALCLGSASNPRAIEQKLNR